MREAISKGILEKVDEGNFSRGSVALVPRHFYSNLSPFQRHLLRLISNAANRYHDLLMRCICLEIDADIHWGGPRDH